MSYVNIFFPLHVQKEHSDERGISRKVLQAAFEVHLLIPFKTCCFIKKKKKWLISLKKKNPHQ